MPTWGHYGLLEKSVRGKVFQGDFHPMSGETLPQHVEVFDEVIHRGVATVFWRPQPSVPVNDDGFPRVEAVEDLEIF